jgi:monofunctional biosynthetic peptidoglycan transglycosylase
MLDEISDPQPADGKPADGKPADGKPPSQGPAQDGSRVIDADYTPEDLVPKTKNPSSSRDLGRFRGGLWAPPREGGGDKPFWRRALVFLVVWGFGLSAAFAAISALIVFIFGWTGPPPTITMAERSAAGADVKRTWVRLKDISPHLVRAVIAAEDQRFCSHDGFDMVEIQNAIEAAEQGRTLRGASTISQQTAKNVFLFQGGGFARKGVEAWFTFLVEKMWTKPRIMEIYLNVAEWGDGNFGAGAAAQARFKTTPKQLSSRQAALLAAVLPSPNRWKITGGYAQRQASRIEARMRMVRRDGLDDCVVK